MARIYVSSTFTDLREHRKEVGLSIRRLGHDDVAMEYYVAEDMRPLERCVADVTRCDVYIGIFAWRYGYVPREHNPERRSITELEYRKARELGKPCLIFLLSEEAPWPKSKQDRGADAERIEALREELTASERHLIAVFDTQDDLARKVSEAIIRWEKENGIAGRPQRTDWDAYREAAYHKHRWVRLQVIAGASRHGGMARIPLIDVFESQLAAAGVSHADVPDEVRKYQEIIYGSKSGSHAEGLGEATLEAANAMDHIDGQEFLDPLFSANTESVLDLVGREPLQVILGGPGAGKTTVLLYSMLRLCASDLLTASLPGHFLNAPIPFFVELRKYVLRKPTDFVGYIAATCQEMYGTPVEKACLEALLKEPGRALVLFDGLDEVFDPDERRLVIERFQSFAYRYPAARVVVTSRIAGYDRTSLGLQGFRHYTLLPLTVGQIRHFVEQWYNYYALEGDERTPQELVQRIIENPRLLDLAGNPMLLTMMAVIYKDRDLPSERWRLYERCAETLLEDWDLGKGIEAEDFKLSVLIKTAQKSEILQRVAAYMLEHGQVGKQINAIAYRPLLDIVATYLEEKYQRPPGEAEALAVDILRHLMERTYVLAGIGERIFGFVHRTFMEYFAACRCQAQFNARKSDFEWLTRDVFGRHWHGGEWDEVLLLLTALLHHQGTPVRDIGQYLADHCTIETKDSAKVPPFNLAFAIRCLAEPGEVQDTAHAQRLLTQLCRAIAVHANNGNELSRGFVQSALEAFAVMVPFVPLPTEIPAIINKLDKSESVPERIAAWQMGFALRSHKERLQHALAALRHKEPVVRRAAISAIEREWPGRADIGPALAKVLAVDRHVRVRLSALAAVQRSWPREPSVLDHLRGRAWWKGLTQAAVLQVLTYIRQTWRGHPEALDLLITAAEAGVGSKVLAPLYHGVAAGWPGDRSALVFLQRRSTIDVTGDAYSAAIAAMAEGWRGDTEALAFLRRIATQDSNPGKRGASILAIGDGWMEHAQSFDLLCERALYDDNFYPRATALYLLAEKWIHNAEGFAFLRDISQSQTPQNVLGPSPHSCSTVRRGNSKSCKPAIGDYQGAFEMLTSIATYAPEPIMRMAGLAAVAEYLKRMHNEVPGVKDVFADRRMNDSAPEVRRLAAEFMGRCAT